MASNSPVLIFVGTFHAFPGPGTTILHGDADSLGDYANVNLAFQTDRATFNRLRPEGLVEVPPETFALAPLPGWWRQRTAATEVWTLKGPGQSFASETPFMTWDEDGLVQYRWEGVD